MELEEISFLTVTLGLRHLLHSPEWHNIEGPYDKASVRDFF